MKPKPIDAMWTDPQWQAICMRGSNILVSAGAGSGKTAVLSERVLELVRSGVHVNDLIVLTFTNAAAREMKERIRIKLEKAKDESDILYESMMAIDSSYITTFDSYCMFLVKKYYYLLDINRNIAISDVATMQQKKMEILSEVINTCVSYDEKLSKLITTYTAVDSEGFKADILKWHNLSKQNMNGEVIINSNLLFDRYEKMIFSQLSNIKNKINKIKLLASETNMPDKIDEKLGDLFNITDFETLRLTLIEITSNKFWMVPRADFSSKEEVKALNDSVKKELKALAANLRHSKSDMIKLLEDNNRRYSHIYQLINTFENELNKYKHENDLYEFIDINLMAIKLLENNPQIAEQLRSQTYEIMIDEYQDTNDIQEYFVNIIANNNVYMVGDIKQAIYGFRNANPKLFAQKFNDYANGQGGKLIVLEENFRSRESVLNQVNDIFKYTMSNQYGGIDYSQNQAMVYGNKSYELCADTNTNEVIVYDKEELDIDQSDYEIYQMIKDIKTKIENKYQVVDNGVARNCITSDFAIICSTREKFGRIIEIGEYMGVTINADILQRYAASMEISVVQSFFNIIKCKVMQNDEDYKLIYSIMQIARSYLFEYTDDEIDVAICNLQKINHNEVNKVLYVLKQGPLVELANTIDRITENTTYLSMSGIYLDIVHNSTIVSNLYKLDNPLSRQLRLAKLEELLSDFDKRLYTIDMVCSYLNDIERNPEFDVEFSFIADSAVDAVTVTTIHKSKGLEYNICYFPFLFKQFNMMDINAKKSYSFNYGLIMPSVLSDETLTDTITKYVHTQQQIKETISEKIRLLYVALTRAKDKNVLLIADDNLHKDIKIENVKTLADIIAVAKKAVTKYVVDYYELEVDMKNAIKYNKLRKEMKTTNSVVDEHVYKEASFSQNVIEKRKASASISGVIEHKVAKNVAKGNEIHELLEFCDILNIQDEIEKSDGLVKNALINLKNSGLLSGVINFYPEFQFKTEVDGQVLNGIIDLLLETENSYIIVDYKLNNIDKPEYVDQVNTYKQYIKNTSNKNVEGFLFSIISGDLKGV